MQAPSVDRSFYAPVESELEELQRRLRDVGRGGHPTFAAAVEHLFGSPGKLLRPTLVFLAARFGPARDLEIVTNLAQSLELVHTASLVHDDIVDGAALRRNVPTVNATWDDDVAIIVGDYLFAKAYALAAVLPKPEVIAIVAQTVFALCDGELAEVTTGSSLLPTEATYLERIELKTASLYAACCQGAALLADADPEHVAALGAYGTNLGLAFQITDDVLDVAGDEAEFGKSVGRDLAEGMPTLPMIYAVAALPNEADLAARIVAPGKDEHQVRELLRTIRASGGVERARDRALAFHGAARAALATLPDQPERDALAAIADFVVRRVR